MHVLGEANVVNRVAEDNDRAEAFAVQVGQDFGDRGVLGPDVVRDYVSGASVLASQARLRDRCSDTG